MNFYIVSSCLLLLVLLALLVISLRNKNALKTQRTVFTSQKVTSLKLQSDPFFLKEEFWKSKLFDKYPVVYKSKFGLEGNSNGSLFQLTELKSKEFGRNIKDQKRNPEVFQFSGIFIKFQLEQNFDFELFLHPDYLERFFGFLGRKVQSIGESYLLVQHADKTFEKQFKILTNNGEKASIILNDKLVQVILETRKILSKRFSIAIHGQQLYVIIPSYLKTITKNDLDEWGSLSDNSQALKIVKQLATVVTQINKNNTY